MTLDRADAAPPLLVPSGSALNPMVLDRRMLLPVLDTNALLTHACWLVRNGYQHDKVTALAGTGRATPYIAAHVPGEIEEHLPRLATTRWRNVTYAVSSEHRSFLPFVWST